MALLEIANLSVRYGKALAIESVSSDGQHAPQLRQAADWLAARIGDASVTDAYGNPLVDGRIPASRQDAPTVLIYGHYDVQPVGDPEAWTTPPFAPDVRDGRIYARGASDDRFTSSSTRAMA